MNDVKQKTTSPKEELDDKVLDLALRPGGFNEYVGQENVKENLAILIDSYYQLYLFWLVGLLEMDKEIKVK